MRVLLVEDESHKAADLRRALISLGIESDDILLASNVRDAVLAISIGSGYDLIILDMALPTFSKESSGSGGVAQPNGGIEVLRTLHAAAQRSHIIVVTQYPELVINGRKARLNKIASQIESLYRQNVVGTVEYSYNDPKWELDLGRAVKAIR